jgi:hypothetical protein
MACALLKWALVATVVASLATAQPLSMCPCAAASEGYRQLWYAHPVGPAGSDEVRAPSPQQSAKTSAAQHSKQRCINNAPLVSRGAAPAAAFVVHVANQYFSNFYATIISQTKAAQVHQSVKS